MSTLCSIEYVTVRDGFENIHVYTECMETDDRVYCEHYNNDGKTVTTTDFWMSRELWEAFAAQMRAKEGGE